MTEGHFELEVTRSLLTALGGMSLSTMLGDGHTIDISAINKADGPAIVEVALYSKIKFEGNYYGIYRVSPVTG